ncbi:MAG TPA: aspartate kinase [Candidatus Sulfotelmatobacter sp.]|nr:aspartate kinase [Candidatus Sulfotelmatobacter sp.]
MSGLQRQSRFEGGEDVVVMKFGGTSVEDANAIQRLIGIVKSRLNAQPVVVVSALAKVTDQLLEAGNAASNGHLGAALATVRNIYVRHEQLADSLLSALANGSLHTQLRGEFQALECLLEDLELSRHLDLKAEDRLSSFGESFSSRLVSWALIEAGLCTSHVDARSCILTDARHGQASPLLELTNQRVQDLLNPLLRAGNIPVLGGFIASTPDGVATTLGRGGSDFSAAIVGAAIGAARIEIWTDVDGVMTTDPKLCPDARVIRKLSFEEAADLAHFGAKVLHPATLAPAMRENIPVHVLNSRHPERYGTEITARSGAGNRVSAITAKRNVVLLEVQPRQGVDAALLNTVFSVLEENNCTVGVMGTSVDRISLLVGSNLALPKIVKDLQEVSAVHWENHKALVCLVGENIRRQPEVASRVFATVSDMDVRVLCQGASERTLSFLVDESKAEESVRRLHSAFFSRVDPTHDWGGISSAFCQAG